MKKQLAYDFRLLSHNPAFYLGIIALLLVGVMGKLNEISVILQGKYMGAI